MDDLISRQAAIDFIDAGHFVNPNEPRWSDNEVVNFLKSRPSVQPERKKGTWIYHEPLDAFECSVCGGQMVRNIFNYCPWCGANMRGEEHEDIPIEYYENGGI